MAEVVRAAARRLRGLRLCEDGREEGAVTHLIIGAERRTIKVPQRLRFQGLEASRELCNERAFAACFA